KPLPLPGSNIVQWMRENLLIRPKGGGLVSFQPNRYQRRIIAHVSRCLHLQQPIRLIVLKSRQLGISTVSEAILFYLLSRFPGTTGLVVAHTERAARNVYQMTRRFYDYMPEQNKIPLRGKLTVRGMEFAAPHGSVLFNMTAGGADMGRSWTLNWVHLSEMAFFPDASSTMAALNQAVPSPSETWQSCYIIESTANGLNLFHDYWRRAQEEDSIWTPMFFSWRDDPRCVITPGKKIEWSKDEIEFRECEGLTPEQMTWVRAVRRDQCHGSWELFNQEYPVSPDRAFLSTGHNFFDLEVVLDRLAEVERRSPLFVGFIRTKSKTTIAPELVPSSTGNLVIYEMPEPNEEYVIGVDCAEGIRAAYSEAIVLRRRDGLEVANFRSNTTPPQDVGVIIWLLGSFYNDALLGVERNSVGQVILTVLEHGHGDISRFPYLRRYPNLYFERTWDRRQPEERERMGYSTSRISRHAGLVRLSEAIRYKEVIPSSPHLLHQLSQFTYQPEKKRFRTNYRDPVSNLYCDDAVFALMLANEMRLISDTSRFSARPNREAW
ncbi:MAG: hypothetical protein ABWK00_06170, partial [Desulfurococcaceae archaeon]